MWAEPRKRVARKIGFRIDSHAFDGSEYDHWIGFAVWLSGLMKRIRFWARSRTDVKVPLSMTCRSILENQISTWLRHEGIRWREGDLHIRVFCKEYRDFFRLLRRQIVGFFSVRLAGIHFPRGNQQARHLCGVPLTLPITSPVFGIKASHSDSVPCR